MTLNGLDLFLNNTKISSELLFEMGLRIDVVFVVGVDRIYFLFLLLINFGPMMVIKKLRFKGVLV